MGYWPIGFLETAQTTVLTALLFLGPLFEAGIADGGWRDWVRLRGINEVIGSWMGYRNLVAVCVVISHAYDVVY
jgi:prenyl protein peptidase